MTLRIAYVTDIHQGDDFGLKKGTQALSLIKTVVDAAAFFKADYIITGGDDISSRDPETDRKNKDAVAQAFSRAACSILKVKGNHCDRYQKKQSPSQIIDTGHHQIMIWNPYLNRYDADGIVPDPEDIIWLETSLAAAAKPTLLFTHVPVKGPPSAQKWKQQGPGEVYYPSNFVNDGKLQNIIESSGKVILSQSGHRHRNFHEESGGVHYLIHQSLVEAVDESGQPSGAFSLFEIDDTEVRIHGHGLMQPKLKTLPISRPSKLIAA